MTGTNSSAQAGFGGDHSTATVNGDNSSAKAGFGHDHCTATVDGDNLSANAIDSDGQTVNAP